MLSLSEFVALLTQSEGPSLEWKRDFPPGLLGKDDKQEWERGRGTVLKDLLAIANAEEKGVGYIIYGVADSLGTRTVVGITKGWDDATFQTWAGNAIEPAVRFRYYQLEYSDGVIVGVLEVQRSADYPHVAVQDVAELHDGQVWYRQGTKNTVAHQPELRRMIRGEEPFKIGRLGDAVDKIASSYRERGQIVVAARMSERDEKLETGYGVAHYPGTRREVWVGELPGGHYELILLTKPSSK